MPLTMKPKFYMFLLTMQSMLDCREILSHGS